MARKRSAEKDRPAPKDVHISVRVDRRTFQAMNSYAQGLGIPLASLLRMSAIAAMKNDGVSV